MQFDYSKLRGKIIEVFGSQSEFAKEIALSERSLSSKMNNKVPFSQLEIECIMNKLNVGIQYIPLYFFTAKVQDVEQKITNKS